MDDKQRAIEALERAGFKPSAPNNGQPFWMSATGSARVHDGLTAVEIWESFDAIPSLLSPLTLEMVEKEMNQVEDHFVGDPEYSRSERKAVIEAFERLYARLEREIEGGANGG